jgi:hypothetical protein
MTRGTRVGLILALVLSASMLAACNSNSSSDIAAIHKFIDTRSAKNAATVALSSLATASPGGKLLYGETVTAITATASPVWQFFIGSPKDNTVMGVLVNNGRASWQPSGKVAMKAAEWSKVPTMTAWKVDSGEARNKALAIYPEGKTARYISGFVTYIPEGSKETTLVAMQWRIVFDPAAKPKKSKAPTTTVLVDMVTGATSFAK